ncbi:MAG TPA: MoaD/ThiS family protein [Beutenbergiaceae bacterium]|nr:MoaD/ThiS family protein [Beutenbergiaceae bacterium]
MSRVRLFAAAAESVGQTEVHTQAVTVTELLDHLSTLGGPGTAEVLGRCSLLINGRRSKSGGDEIPSGAVVDVLPPFAGG